jgi:NADH-quinone oxidoreductase subunit G
MPPQKPQQDGYFICDFGRFSGKDFSRDRLHTYALNGTKATSKEALPALAEKIAAAKKILVLGGATESCDDVDTIESEIKTWRAAGKAVVWDFRTDKPAFTQEKDWDFLLSRDLRPNAKYLRDKNATQLADYAAVEKEIRGADLILIVGELATPYAYQSNEPSADGLIAGGKHAQVKGLAIADKVEDTALFDSINAATAWNKVALLTTHDNTAAELAAIAIPMLAFPEKSGRFIDKAGNAKITTQVLQHVQGLESPAQILTRLKSAPQAAGAAV